MATHVTDRQIDVASKRPEDQGVSYFVKTGSGKMLYIFPNRLCTYTQDGMAVDVLVSSPDKDIPRCVATVPRLLEHNLQLMVKFRSGQAIDCGRISLIMEYRNGRKR